MVAALAEDDPERLVAARKIALRGELSHGTAGTGSVTSELPPERARALDLLSQATGFFTMQTQQGARLVNRRQLRLVFPLD